MSSRPHAVIYVPILTDNPTILRIKVTENPMTCRIVIVVNQEMYSLHPLDQISVLISWSNDQLTFP